MPLPPDIQQRVAKAKASGFTPDQIKADIQRKYGVSFDVQPAAPATPQKKTLAEKIGGFLGISNFGKGLGVALATGSGDVKAAQAAQENARQTAQKALQAAQKYAPGDPRREALLRAAGNAQKTISEDSQAAAGVADAPTKKQFLAGAANTFLNIAGAGTIGGKTAAGGAVKGFQLAGKMAEQPLKAAVLQSALQGGAQSAANKWGEGAKAGEVATAGAGGAAMGAATTGILGLIGKLARHATTSVPETIYKTSTQMKRGDSAMPLIEEGITGNRAQVLEKAGAMNKGAWEAAISTPEAADLLTPSAAMKYGPLKEALARADRLGGTEAQQAKAAVEQYVTGRGPQTREALMRLVQDIDATTPAAAFQDRSTSVRSTVENAIADAFRNLTQGDSPAIAGQMDRAQAARQVINAVEGQMNSKQSVPGFISGIVQRGILTPGVGTRAARLGYLAGAPARALAKGPLNDAVRRALRALLVSGEANAVTGQ